jgi:hypothetical protein
MNLQMMDIHLSRRKKFSSNEKRIRRERTWWQHEKLLLSTVPTHLRITVLINIFAATLQPQHYGVTICGSLSYVGRL